jgi:hypothetical protein
MPGQHFLRKVITPFNGLSNQNLIFVKFTEAPICCAAEKIV